MGNIAIIVVTYDRLPCLRRLIDCLQQADYDGREVPLIVSVDKSGNDRTGEYVSGIRWPYGPFRPVLHPENLGLRKHILSCGDYLDEYDAVIVLEDDLTVSRDFYRYACQCVETYAGDPTIAGISLYGFGMNYLTRYPFRPVRDRSDVYLMRCAMSWGEVWMRDAWRRFRAWYDTHSAEFDNLPHIPDGINRWGNNSWLKYHTRYCIEEQKYFVFPYDSLSTNNGDPGTHGGRSSTLLQTEFSLPRERFLLPPAGEIKVRYDGFFEPEFLAEALDVPAEELCVDLWGTKQGRIGARYRLTLASLPYRRIATYDLACKPIEMNILTGRKGDAIRLYDTTAPDAAPREVSLDEIYDYRYGDAYLNFLRKYRLGGAVRRVFRTILQRIKDR